MFARLALGTVVAAAAFYTPTLVGQELEVSTIVTDRPSVGVPPDVIPAHSMQVENGLNSLYSGSSYSVDLPDSLLRVGIGARAELRLVTTNLMHSAASDGPFLQEQDLFFGSKVALTKPNGFLPQSILFAVSVPTGSPHQSSGSFDQDAILIWQQNVSHGFVVIENVGALRTTTDGKRSANWMPGIYISHAVSARTSAFAEYAPTIFSAGGTLHVIHGGFAWNPVPTRQFDIRAGVQNDSAGRHNILSVGYSVRLDGIVVGLHRYPR